MSEVGHCHHSIPASRRVCILAYSLMNYHHVWREKWIGKKLLVRHRHTFYFIHTEIYTVKYYRSCLWLDERCIFTGVCPKSLNWNLKKSQFVWNKNIIKTYHGKCLNDFYSLVAMHQKTHSFPALTRWFFFLILRNSCIKMVRAHFPRNNL